MKDIAKLQPVSYSCKEGNPVIVAMINAFREMKSENDLLKTEMNRMK